MKMHIHVIGCLILLLLLPRFASAQETLAQQEEAAFKAAATYVSPSVVQIQTFGGLDHVGETLTGEGPTTGLIVSADGYIVSSAFTFAAKPSAAVVTLSDGQKLDAEIVATDFSRMITLLQVDASDLPVPEAAPIDEIRVGQWTLAVGKVFDIEIPNVSPGILSARNRIWGKAIQTDAKISPYNYGGPLIDIRGRVLGVIVPLSMTSDGVMAGAEWYDSGIGFAIPFAQVRAAVERLQSGEDLHRGTLGIVPEQAGNLFAEPRVAQVRAGSAAAEAGFETGDLILAIDKVEVARTSDVMQQLGPHYAGDVVSVRIQRGDEEKTFDVVLTKPSQTSIIPQQKAIPQPGEEGVPGPPGSEKSPE